MQQLCRFSAGEIKKKKKEALQFELEPKTESGTNQRRQKKKNKIDSGHNSQRGFASQVNSLLIL